MPTYEFRCQACDKTYAVVLSIRERTESTMRCPAWRSDRVEPLPTLFAARTARKS